MIIIDRIEACENGYLVVCEADGGEMKNIPLSLFSYSPKEGDCIYEQNGRYFLDSEATESRSEKIGKLMRSFIK